MNEPRWTEFGFDVANDGRLPLTVEGLSMDSRPMTLAGMGAASQIDKPCSGNFAPGSMMVFETVDLRYRYLRVFERDVTVHMPFTVGLVCGELPKPYNG